ncbi:DUF6308 family protein [Streptomyces sp. NPDC029041]|uniref:DUF6308 family protein n=1 Tax=Streptomyces sp. NPDC029041 TaxID=3155727 RepID=UPI0033CAAB21
MHRCPVLGPSGRLPRPAAGLRPGRRDPAARSDRAHTVRWLRTFREVARSWLTIEETRLEPLLALRTAAGVGSGGALPTGWRMEDPRVLCNETGIGWVTAGKLLARKRPLLLPVYDQVVRCILGRPVVLARPAWCAECRQSRAAPPTVVPSAVRRPPATVSALRVCDVVLWMRHRTDHQQKSCIGV